MKKVFIAGCALSLLTACASNGNESLRNQTQATVATQIKNGVTTKEEVRKQFGDPTETSFTDGGKEIWKYRLDNVSADAVSYVPVVNMFGASASGTRKELVILFDGDTVSKYTMSSSAVSQKTGLFNN
ncbi:hypothetical protein [Asaia bogorensis]|uniref:Lipoprotein n=1 Tax=Asaia bogorensis NBRC 16594 TaxID=1231624 RepID=A0AAN4U2J0_9PROT|nr:hypothetical protein [Asaia bogorensis]MDR6181445.1 outer membrane protein assembly factor BamE (lipoprotein component of BamABCDE complex) [Asaia bogorensis NBRC 16594]BAT19117.1 lipoprotein [Asaia bogorensis NBRC 16594]GBQ73141.1 lipoprotein [Asaia bogorensis NBRC 16594]GEL53472.1 hypothetical protein ABO01nite_14790 [Asaia bogorensis NBRC 16594]